MFVPVMKQTNWKLDGKYVTPIEHESIKECTEWLKSYESQPHYIYGNVQHAYTYISTQYPNRINWDMDKILMITIDIEVQCENGFPDPQKNRTTTIYYNQTTRTNALWFGVSVSSQIVEMMLHILNVK